MPTDVRRRRASRSRAWRRRRGGLYLYVVCVSLLVSLLGMAALTTTRIHRRMNEATIDAAAARLYAQAALRMGMLRIEQDPNWRYTRQHGIWEANVPMGDGTYTLEGLDPSDGDLADRAEEPLVLLGTGRCGSAVQKMQLTLVPTNRGYTALKLALHAGNDLNLSSATLNCSQAAGAGHDSNGAGGSNYNCDVEVVNNLKGGTYNGGTRSGVTARTQPAPADAFAYYLANGTWIDKNALPVGYSNVLKNAGFESGTADWSGVSCTLAPETVNVQAGTRSLAVKTRASYLAGPEQIVTDVIQSGVAYDVSAWIKATVSSSVKFGFQLTIVSSGSGSQTLSTTQDPIKNSDGWKQVVKAITPTWSGSLTSAKLRIVNENNGHQDDFFADALSFKEQGADRNICRKVLSPTSNPYGAATNPQGIYLLDLADDKLFVKFARIVGTLVIVNPKAGSAIGDGGPLHWEPAIPGFPALLVKGKDLLINPSNAGLNESANLINFNPPGAPYQGATDADQSDIYPSEIRGLIYGEKKLQFANSPSIYGAVMSATNIEASGVLNVTHNAGYFLSPPPGFNGPEQIRILLDSIRKPLN